MVLKFVLGHQGEMYNTVSVPLSEWFVLVEVYYAFRAMFPIWLAELGLLLDLVLGRGFPAPRFLCYRIRHLSRRTRNTFDRITTNLMSQAALGSI